VWQRARAMFSQAALDISALQNYLQRKADQAVARAASPTDEQEGLSEREFMEWANNPVTLLHQLLADSQLDAADTAAPGVDSQLSSDQRTQPSSSQREAGTPTRSQSSLSRPDDTSTSAASHVPPQQSGDYQDDEDWENEPQQPVPSAAPAAANADTESATTIASSSGSNDAPAQSGSLPSLSSVDDIDQTLQEILSVADRARRMLEVYDAQEQQLRREKPGGQAEEDDGPQEVDPQLLEQPSDAAAHQEERAGADNDLAEDHSIDSK